ncbi:universal stress protein [Sulfurimicrobium lacus]|nr:universal stress protein [Sulfurimicrobium lacus]
MFERFIVATDLSPASDAVVGCLAGLRVLGASHALLLQCLDMQQATSIALSYTTSVLDDYLARQKARLEGQGFEVETRIVPGFAKSEVNRIAREEDYGLVVVGSHGHSMLGEALLGGVASEVLHGAGQPILVMRLERNKDTGEVCVLPAGCDLAAHVLFPTDFSENADLAFTVVENMAAAGTRRITLMHVQDSARLAPHLAQRLTEFDAIDHGRLEELKARLVAKGVADVDIELRAGKPFLEIVNVAKARGVHLVVMGSQGRGFVPELFLGSVSHEVARHANAPVLLVPVAR